ncbi:MAG TPA: M20/M25/M40 family metallo-hydrolase [Ktedonobacteraceae bacterium]|nr:M20/M25/M40 family metallo-hydrolase [Ktedonobacteraceae bacterium]
MSFNRLCHTLIELVGIPSTTGHEEQVRAYIEQRVTRLGLSTQVDAMGNLIATLDGTGQPLLLNAHMDRVPPGLGHTPIVRDGILYSDGNTNLGADDAAGIAIILETLTRIVEEQLPHPPLVVVFTVQEEAGLCGATTFDAAYWHVTDGIVFDNAFEAGVVVSKGAAYEAFDIRITGHTGHPGKDLSHTVDAIEIFRATSYPHGSLANDQTRILFSRVIGGSARNAVPASLLIEGELRSFEAQEVRERYLQEIRSAFEQTAHLHGGQVEMTINPHSKGYTLDENEPLLTMYRDVLAQRGAKLQLHPTFIGSDTSGFRPAIRAFTLSTGVVNEHSVDEYVPLAPLEQVVKDALQVLRMWAER